MSDILTIFLFLHTIHIFFYSRKTPYLHISHNICFPYLYIPYLKYPLNKFSLSPHLLKGYHIIYNTLLFLIHLFFYKPAISLLDISPKYMLKSRGTITHKRKESLLLMNTEVPYVTFMP